MFLSSENIRVVQVCQKSGMNFFLKTLLLKIFETKFRCFWITKLFSEIVEYIISLNWLFVILFKFRKFILFQGISSTGKNGGQESGPNPWDNPEEEEAAPRSQSQAVQSEEEVGHG